MGILNTTPDSFSDGAQYLHPQAAYDRAYQMCEEGVDIIDIGAESTRPGAEHVPAEIEIERLLPVIERIKTLSKPISIDTQKTAVMKAVLPLGIEFINDVNALQDDGAVELLAQYPTRICLMHKQGTPQTMQQAPQYNDVIDAVKTFLQQRIDVCMQAGIDKSRLILDPGFGFGKTLEHNLQLLYQLDTIVAMGYPVLVGISRKSMLGTLTGKPVDQRLAAGLACATIALMKGAKIIRTHDVAATLDVCKVFSHAIET